MLVRPATIGDLPALVTALGQEDYFSRQLERQRLGLGVLLVAWVDGTPVGDVYLWREPAEEPEIREHLPGVPLLIHLEVMEVHRGRGIGTELLHRAERLLREQGHGRVALGVGLDNHRATNLYKRHGYVEWAHANVESGDEIFQVLVKDLTEQ